MTWAVRVLIVIDLAIVLVLWPAARDPGHDVTLRGVFRQWIALPIAIVTAAFAWIVLSFPGEPHAEWTRYWPDEYSRLTAHKFGDGLECRTQSPISLVRDNFDRLYLPRVNVVDDDKLEKIEAHTKKAGEPDYQGERTRPLRKRDFNCALFSGYADLRRVDFAEASLRGALFASSKLQGASLDYAQLQGASLQLAQLQGAFLDGAQLQGASLHGAQLQGASFIEAKLQGASLSGARLQGANLDDAASSETVLSSTAVWRARNANCSDARVQGGKYDAIIQFNSDETARGRSSQIRRRCGQRHSRSRGETRSDRPNARRPYRSEGRHESN